MLYFGNLTGILVICVTIGLSGCSILKSQAQQRSANQSPAPSPLASPPIRHSVAKRTPKEHVEAVVRQYCNLARDGKLDELKLLIRVLPRKQPVLSEKQKRRGTTVPNFQILSEMEKAILLDDIPAWIAIGPMRITDVHTEFETIHVATVTTLLSSQAMPDFDREIIFRLTAFRGEWKISSVVWDAHARKGKTGSGTAIL